MTAEIPLRNGGVALVDEADAARLSGHAWYREDRAHTSYACRQARVGRKVVKVYLHREVLGLAHPSQQADHANGDGLDNRRANLRPATRSENMANRRAAARDIPYRGVYRSRRGRPYRAQITAAGRVRHLGQFDSPEVAALAYDRAALAAFGPFAVLNFPLLVRTAGGAA